MARKAANEKTSLLITIRLPRQRMYIPDGWSSQAFLIHSNCSPFFLFPFENKNVKLIHQKKVERKYEEILMNDWKE